MKKLILLFALACFFTSCNVSESIVFKADMSGEYITSFDLSPLMDYANKSRPKSVEKKKKESMDTTIVFNDLFKTHQDSIATLTKEQRDRLENLRGMVMRVRMDEENGLFDFNMKKSFNSFEELKGINEQVGDAMGIAKDLGNKDGQAPSEQLDELTKKDKVLYTFKDNTFTRFMPNSKDDETEELEQIEEGYEEEDDDFSKQFQKQFEDVFSGSNYTLVYTFPRKVKSVSKAGASISEDGKTVTYEVSWDTLQKDRNSMNLNIVLED